MFVTLLGLYLQDVGVSEIQFLFEPKNSNEIKYLNIILILFVIMIFKVI